MRHLDPYFRLMALLIVLLANTSVAHAQSATSGDNSMTYNNKAVANGSSNFLNLSADISPSLYTGGLEMSLPLYVLKSSNLQVPISLAYTAANGVRPSDQNTMVGMDWMLMAGGSVSRQVRGLPDESTYGYIGTHLEGNIVVNDFNSPNGSVTQGFNNTYNQQSAHTAVVDGEPDIFVITTPSFTAQFTLDQGGNPVFHDNTGLRIIQSLYNNSTNASNTGITVIDAQGTQYIFGSSDSSREKTTTKFFGQSQTYVSSWHLNKIIPLNAGDEIDFYYTMVNDYSVYNYLQSKLYTATWPSATGFPWTTDPTSESDASSLTIQISTTTYSPRYISRILSRLGEADFTYTNNSNANINTNNPAVLSTITIKQLNPAPNQASTVLQTLNFSYTDIETGTTGLAPPFPDPSLWSDYYRRLLHTVTITGNTTATATPLTLYNLSYYQSPIYPNRETCQNWDFWGYPNAMNYLSDIDNEDASYYYYPDQSRQPASITPTGGTQPIPMAALMALSQIDQLGGASTHIYYGQNDYYNGSANVAIGGTRVESVARTLPTGERLTTGYSYVDASGHSTGQIQSDIYRRERLYFANGSTNNALTMAFSQSPYGISDDAGVMVGYSSVKVTSPNGGSIVNSFTNFSDYPDNISVPSFFSVGTTNSTYGTNVSEQLSSFSYKRGLLKGSITYKANGDMVSQDINTYGSADNLPVAIKEIGIQDNTWWPVGDPVSILSVNIYHSNIENWRLLQTVHYDYDQLRPSQSMQTTTNWTYAPDGRQIRQIAVTDSKGQNHIRTFYYSNDTNIPFATAEQSTLALMAAPAVNATSLPVHQTDSRNGVVRHSHTTYTAVQLGAATNFYPTTTTVYNGNTAEQQQFFNYDASSSKLISSNVTGGKMTSTAYGYNLSYPVIKIENAANTASSSNQQSTQNGFMNFQSGGGPQNAQFTLPIAGTIIISMPAGSYLSAQGGVTVTASYFLSGPSSASGSLCNSSIPNFTCSSPGSILTLPNMPAGVYTLSVSPNSTWPNANGILSITYSYPGTQIVNTGYTEFFYEGFEQNSNAQQGNAHTGSMYQPGGYSPLFTPPNNKQYIIQWWDLSGSQWVFHQQPYTSGMSLSGSIDDVRIFPADALMTTYTYSPLLGKTSETDPSGRTKTYQYDGLGRLMLVRDQDGNILKQYDYQYQVGLQQ